MDFPVASIAPILLAVGFLLQMLTKNKEQAQTSPSKSPGLFGITPPDSKKLDRIADDDPAEFIKTIGKGQVAIVPVYTYKLGPGIDIITRAFIRDNFGKEFSNLALGEPLAVEKNGLKGYEFGIPPVNKFENATIRILEGTRFAYMFIILSNGENRKLQEYSDGIRLQEPSVFEEKKQSHIRKIQNLAFLNSCGLMYHQMGQFQEAQRFYKKSFDLSQRFEMTEAGSVYFNNILTVLMDIRDYEGILSEINENRFKPNIKGTRLSLMESQALHHTGRSDEARAILQGLVEKNELKNDDDFEVYLKFLIDTNQKELAIEHSREYLKSTPSLYIKLYLISLLQGMDRHQEAIEVLKSEEKRIGVETRLGTFWIDSCLALGDYKKGFEIVEKLTRTGLNTDLLHYKTGLLHAASGDYEKSRDSFQKALEKNPDSLEIQGALERVSGFLGRGNNSTIQEEIPALELPDLTGVLVEALDPTEEEPDAIFEEIGKVFEYNDGEILKSTETVKIKILSSRAISTFTSYSFTFDSLYEKVYVNEIQVVDNEGQIHSPPRESYYVQDDQEASYKKVVTVPLPGVTTGCTIHIRLSRSTLSRQEKIPYHQFYLVRPYPVLNSYLAFRGDTIHTGVEMNRFFEEKGSSENLRLFVANRVPAYHYEPRQVPPEELYPFLNLFDNRLQIGDEVNSYYDQIKHTFVLSDPIRAKAESLTAGLSDPQEKVFAIQTFVVNHLRYTAIEFGVRGIKPAEASDSLLKGYGDCKDHSVLMKSMLQAIQIQCDLVLVNSFKNTSKSIPSLDQFNHMIVHVPALDRFFDPTLKLFGNDCPVPYGSGSRVALLLNPERPHFVEIPDYKDHLSKVEITRDIVKIDGDFLEARETVTLDRYYGGFLRQDLQQVPPNQRENYMQNRIQFPYNTEVSRFRITHDQDSDQPVQVEVEYRTRLAGGVNAGDQGGFQLPIHWETMYIGIEKTGPRKTPFRIEYPLLFTSRTTLPEGVVLADHNETESLEETHRFGSFAFRIEGTDGAEKTPEIQFEVSILSGTYKPGEQNDLDDYLKKAIAPLSRKWILKS